MEENLLSFREWSDNFVRVKYDLNWYEATILSFDERIEFITGKEKVKELLINQSRVLLSYYKSNFDKIQKQFLNQTI
jgi:hypothetical protein